MKSQFISFALLVLSGVMFAQTNDPVLMTINGKSVHKSEFEYIYNKNNSNNSLDKKTLEEYVDLFVNFKLKVEEAKAQGLDTTKSFVNELAGYRSQLTKPYLTDSKVDEDVLQEAYSRMKEDVEVSHILVRIPQTATPADTLAAWKKILSIAKRLEKEDFAKVAKETSEDQSAEENGGYIGWISPGQLPPEFDVAIASMQPGSVSDPIRTDYGWHLIQLLNRKQSELSATQQKDFAKASLRQSKLEQAYSDWIQELKCCATIEYRPPYDAK